jgi:hypothetical protein
MKRAAQQRKGMPSCAASWSGNGKGNQVLRPKRKLPTKVFVHQEGCPIAKVDPDVEILSSYEDKTARHLGRCEYIGETPRACFGSC